LGTMDYDATGIPAVYDLGRSHAPAVLDLWMATLRRFLPNGRVTMILDLGCGTGRFTEALATHFAATVLGVDPSEKMLAQARAKRSPGSIRYVRGSGESIPLAKEFVDLIFMSMVFHHFTSPHAVARECRRVSRTGGTVFIRAGTTDHISAYPYVPFIPATKPLLHERLNPKREITQTFVGSGFALVATDVVVQQIASTHAAYADKLAVGGDSILASLSPGQLEEGLAALRLHAAAVDPLPVTEPIDVFVFRNA
jgi:ubiquinone/menaquinone biosynthesis C-methylase UbiE